MRSGRSHVTGTEVSGYLPAVALFILYLVYIAGDFSVYDVEVRLPGLMLVAIFTFMCMIGPAPKDRVNEGHRVLLWFALWVAWLMLAGLWAATGSQLGTSLADLAYLMALVGLSAMLLARVPTRHLQALWVAVVVVAAVFAAASLLMGTVTEGQGRLAAFGGGPNVFVRIVALGCMGVVALTLGRSSGRSRWLMLLIPVLGVAAILSGSRGGVLGLASGVLLLGLLALGAGERKVRRDLGIVAVIVAGGFAFWGWDRVAPYIARRYIEQTLVEQHDAGRSAIWEYGLDLFDDHPIIGNGLDGFRWGTQDAYPHAHNLFLGSAVEGGTVALILLCISVIVGFRDAIRLVGASFRYNVAACAAATIMVSAMFSGTWYDSRLIWLFLLLGSEIWKRDSSGRNDSSESASRERRVVGRDGAI